MVTLPAQHSDKAHSQPHNNSTAQTVKPHMHQHNRPQVMSTVPCGFGPRTGHLPAEGCQAWFTDKLVSGFTIARVDKHLRTICVSSQWASGPFSPHAIKQVSSARHKDADMQPHTGPMGPCMQPRSTQNQEALPPLHAQQSTAEPAISAPIHPYHAAAIQACSPTRDPFISPSTTKVPA